MKKSIITIIFVFTGILTTMAQPTKTGVGLTFGFKNGLGFTYKHFFNEKNGMKIYMVPPIFYDGDVVFTDIGGEYYRVLSLKNNRRISFTVSGTYLRIGNESILILPSLGIENEIMITEQQSIALSFSWSGFMSFSDFPVKGTVHYQTFPTGQIEYIFYLK